MKTTSLRDYLNALSQRERESFAIAVGTTIGHLKNVAYDGRRPSAALAMQIDIKSDGVVPRSQLRPHDHHLIWPVAKNNQLDATVMNVTQPNGVSGDRYGQQHLGSSELGLHGLAA